MTTDDPTAEREKARRAAFRDLVAVQDAGSTVQSYRRDVARRFGLREEQVRAIEREGIENQWPPLGGTPGKLRRPGTTIANTPLLCP